MLEDEKGSGKFKLAGYVIASTGPGMTRDLQLWQKGITVNWRETDEKEC